MQKFGLATKVFMEWGGGHWWTPYIFLFTTLILDNAGYLGSSKKSAEVWFCDHSFYGGWEVHCLTPKMFLFTPLILDNFRKNNDKIMNIFLFTPLILVNFRKNNDKSMTSLFTARGIGGSNNFGQKPNFCTFLLRLTLVAHGDT